LDELRAAVRQRVERCVEQLEPAGLGELLDGTLRQVLADGFDRAGAHEGTLWWAQDESLVPAFNTGPHAQRMVGQFRQPLSSGLICMVFSTEQPFIENAVHRNARQSKLLDELLQVQTWALMAVPLVVAGAARGVVSCVQLKPGADEPPDPPGFGPEQLSVLARTAAVTGRLIEYKLLSQALGWQP
jgi:hypothetical protein